MTVQRNDRAIILDSQESDYGFLTVECVITKTGVMSYLDSDGNLQKEAKLPEDIFAEDTIESAKGVPASKEHPNEFPIDTSNYTEHMKGMTHTNVVKEDDTYLVVSVTVFDEQLIEEIKTGIREEVSIGLECTLVEESGTYNGEDYDYKQTNIKINHIAFTKKGRAGSDVKARLDSAPDLSIMQPTSTQPVMDYSDYKQSDDDERTLNEKKFWEVRKDADKNIGELRIYGQIVNLRLWEEEVSVKSFTEEMEELGDVDEINLYINSPGGSVFAGNTINTILKRHDATINVFIDAMAASIASVIAMAGDNVYMPKHAMMMIHQPMAGIWGDAEEMRDKADFLDKITEASIATYQEKSDLSREKLIEMMDEETWLLGSEAYELGFIDAIETFDSLKTSQKMDSVIPKSLLDTPRSLNYEGTETTDWGDVDKTFDACREGYYAQNADAEPDSEEDKPESVEDAPAPMKEWIAQLGFLGETDAETFDDLLVLPAVNPTTFQLNSDGLDAVKQFAPQVDGISDDTVEQVPNRVDTLLEEEFGGENHKNKEDEFMTIKLDGEELNEEKAQEKLDSLVKKVDSLEKEKNTLDADLTAKKKELEKVEENVDELEKEIEEQPDLDERMDEKLELFAEASKYVPEGTLDPKDSMEDMKLAVISEFDEDINLEEKGEGFVDAYFESSKKALEKMESGSFVLDQSNRKKNKDSNDSGNKPTQSRLKNN